MAIQMTREEYRRKYGVDPITDSSALDIKPAPPRMTRAEYNALYGEAQTPQPTLMNKLGGRVADIGDALVANKPSDLVPGRSLLRVGGAVAGGINDTIGAALSPLFNKAVDKISDSSTVQAVATSKPGQTGLDTVNAATNAVGEQWKGFESSNPNVAQDLRDVGNIASLLPLKAPITKVNSKIAPLLEDRVITKRAEEIAVIEGKYSKTRKANEFSDDAGNASRARIAQTDVLVDAVDENGLIRTKTPGGAIDQYKAQTIDGYEDIVRRNLKQSKDVVDLSDVKIYLTREVMKSGLDGADLVTALKGIDRELEGLGIRTKGNSVIDLTYLQDAKIGTTKNINYLTPPETSTYRKSVARAYKKIIEEKSTVKVDVDGKSYTVKDINKELAKFYDDIKRLERLDGARVEGGKLGKYLAQGIGTALGAGAGSIGGGAGAFLGGAIGGEAGAFLKGKAMASKFGRATGKTAPKSALLERAKLNVPDAKVAAPKGVAKSKEISTLEDDIAKNVEMQKAAIKKGNFALVQALKEIYTTLVEALKAEITRVREMAKGQGQRGFVNFNSQRKNDLISDQKKATNPPTIAQSIPSKVPKLPAEVKINIVDIIDDYRLKGGENLELQQDAARIAEDFDIPMPKTYGALVKKLEEILESQPEMEVLNQ
jgi:hypothetical protein